MVRCLSGSKNMSNSWQPHATLRLGQCWMAVFFQLGEMGFDPSQAQAQDPRLTTDSPQSFWSFWHGAPSMEVPPNHPKLHHLRIETHSDLGNLRIPRSKKSPFSADFYIRVVRHRTLVILGAHCLSATSTYEVRNSVGFKVSLINSGMNTSELLSDLSLRHILWYSFWRRTGTTVIEQVAKYLPSRNIHIFPCLPLNCFAAFLAEFILPGIKMT